MSGVNPNPTQVWQVEFDANNKLDFYNQTINTYRRTTQVFRDVGAWYHIVFSADTNNATPQNRFRCWINGVEVTAWDVNSTISSGYSFAYNGAYLHGIGAYTYSGNGLPLDGYLADVYFVDGQPLTPTDFGAFDGNNYWTPKAYTGTYGTNGFHLEFEDFSAVTAAAIGKDTSGRGNNWTPSAGINLTTPANTNASWDSMVDVPTQTSTDVANFAILNPLFNLNGVTGTYTNGNLNFSAPTATDYYYCSTIFTGESGKYYYEVTVNAVGNGILIGAINQTQVGTAWGNKCSYRDTGLIYDLSGTAVTSGSTYTTNDVIGVAIDIDAGTVQFYKNSVAQGATPSVSFTAGTPLAFAGKSNNNGANIACNFGQRPFRYTPPTGFKSLNSFNVAEVVGDVETPDLVRIKSRSATTPALWFNSVSGEGKYLLGNNNTSAEATDVNSLIQFNKNGLLIGNNANINTLNATYIADVWKAGSTTQNITVGQYATSPANIPSIASTVRANPISGISVVTYTGNQTAGATVGHGLGVAPSLIIIKSRGAVTSWPVYHKAAGATKWTILNSTLGATTSAQEWNNTAPTTNVFSIGNSSANSNQSTTNVAFCFAEIDGFSKFGSYISNGSSTDGPFVYTGFRPRWVMIKQLDVTRSWIMYDTTRNTFNVVDKYFFMEGLNNNEQTAALLDINSNGFKLKNNNVNTNTTAGQVYIYVAFAEHPFKYALAR
jgi:hypothetical protein